MGKFMARNNENRFFASTVRSNFLHTQPLYNTTSIISRSVVRCVLDPGSWEKGRRGEKRCPTRPLNGECLLSFFLSLFLLPPIVQTNNSTTREGLGWNRTQGRESDENGVGADTSAVCSAFFSRERLHFNPEIALRSLHR